VVATPSLTSHLAPRAPPARPKVGHHFSRFGRVMDLVLVKDFGTLLGLAAQATALEQQRAAAGEMLGRHFARERLCSWRAGGASAKLSALSLAAAAPPATLLALQPLPHPRRLPAPRRQGGAPPTKLHARSRGHH
jgi:hypothetical protein